MKTTLKLLLAGILAALCCSVGKAQIIYSNNFSLGAAVNITNTPPTVVNAVNGGIAGAKWVDCLGTNSLNGNMLQANGLLNVSNLPNSYLLYFVPQSGHIYLLEVNLTWTGNPNNWIGVGFGQNCVSNVANGFARFSDNQAGGVTSPRGADWLIMAEVSGNVQYFGGPGAGNTVFGANNAMYTGFGTHTARVILNTKNTLWSCAGWVDGVQMGSTLLTYSSNPTIHAVGLTENTSITNNVVQFNYLTLSTTLEAFITTQPTSQSLSYGDAYTNWVGVTADTGGGTVAYQWYTNGVPLVNGGAISGVTTSNLVINPVSYLNATTNLYVVVTNNYASVTSIVTTLTVYTTPVITGQFPISYTNPITLFGGTNDSGTNYIGSSPTFSVSAVGARPLTYHWQTNGVPVLWATNASFTFTNCSLRSPTNFACIITNVFGPTPTTNWLVAYKTTPYSGYPQAVLASRPYGFWRIDDADNGSANGNYQVPAFDYQGGNNGLYTNVTLNKPGYNGSEPTETAGLFGGAGLINSGAGQITNVDVSVTNGANAQFTVEAWANCVTAGALGGGPVASKGSNLFNEEFTLGVNTNITASFTYQFRVRSASGLVYIANSSVGAADTTWHHLVGVCDEAHTNVSLYIDGKLAASAAIPANAGLTTNNMPMTIGTSPRLGGAPYQFGGYIDDVSVYKYALSSIQVASHYLAFGGSLPPSFVQIPPTDVTVDEGAALVIPTTLLGSPTMSYTWTDVNAGTNLATGSTNGLLLDTTLTYTHVPVSWDGDTLQLSVNNGAGSVSSNIIVHVLSGAPVIATDVQPVFGAVIGGAASDTVGATGTEPFHYHWQFNGVNLTDVGGITGSQTATLNVANAQLTNRGSYQVIVTNIYGAATSSVATFVIENYLPITFNNGLGWVPTQFNTYTTPVFTNGVLNLLDGGGSQTRTFFFNYPLYIGAWKATYTYRGSGIANGSTFCIQNDPRGASATGGTGGRIGVGGNLGVGIPDVSPSWELEFNIYIPYGVGYLLEQNGAFGGSPGPQFMTMGDPAIPAQTNMVASGDPIDVTLNYANGMFSMVLTDSVANVSFSTNVNIGNLPTIVGGNTAYVGFTSSSGGSGATVTISNFTFVSLPTTAIQLNGNNALITWPQIITGYQLQQESDVMSANWLNVTNVPTATNNLNQVTLPVGTSNLFYRLILQ